MDNIILGLLNLADLTLYDIKNTFQKGIYFMYSSSAGSIQSALKTLMLKDFITYTEYIENGRNKKLYKITSEGRTHFIEWLSIPMNSMKLNNVELGKLFFMGTLPCEKRIPLIIEYINNLQGKIEVVTSIKEQALKIKVKDEQKDIAIFQLATIDFAIASIQFEIEWYRSLCKRMEDTFEII